VKSKKCHDHFSCAVIDVELFTKATKISPSDQGFTASKISPALQLPGFCSATIADTQPVSQSYRRD
jgi:hypothetical protein